MGRDGSSRRVAACGEVVVPIVRDEQDRKAMGRSYLVAGSASIVRRIAVSIGTRGCQPSSRLARELSYRTARHIERARYAVRTGGSCPSLNRL